MASTDSDTLTGRSPVAPGDFHVANDYAMVITTKVDKNLTTSPMPLSVSLIVGANVNAPTALNIYVEPNSGDGSPTAYSFTGLGIYMEDIGSATVNHLIGIDIGMNSNNTATDWHAFLRMKGHSGTAKALFKINAAATYLFDFQGADTAAPLASNYSTLTCRMPDGTSRTLALS